MRSFRDLPLRRKVVLIILGAGGVALLLVGGTVAILYEVYVFRPRVESDLKAQADLLRANLHAKLRFGDPRAALETLKALDSRPEIEAACIFNPDGTVFVTYARPDLGNFSCPEIGEHSAEAKHELSGDYLLLFEQIVEDGELLGTLFLRRKLPLSERSLQYTLLLGTVSLALLPVSFLLSFALKRFISSPLFELAQAAQVVRDQEVYRVRVAKHGNDEIGYLTEAFNQMLETIEQRKTALRTANRELEATARELKHELVERRRVEAALRESQRFNQQIADSMPSMLYVQDLTERRLTYVNSEVENILGYTPEQVLAMGLRLFEGLPPSDRTKLSGRLTRLAGAQEGEIVETEFRIQHADGDYRWLISRDTIFQRDGDGNARQILGVAQDITEQKRLQEQLLQAQKMESIGRLAGGVAHDFNNLLTVIVGSVDLLREQLPPDSSHRPLLDNVRRATTQASNLTHQLLAFARKQIIEPKVMSLETLILDAEKMLRSLLGDDVELVVLQGRDLWSIQADPSQMMQVLLNLAVNARDAMPGGGTLTLETRNVEVGDGYSPEHPVPSPGGYAMLSVSDTGEGMSEEAQAHLFEPFCTTKEVGKGTGLGLATCYGIIKQSGGHIRVESELGGGSLFHIYMPRASRPADTPTSAIMTQLPSGQETILVVEDNGLVRATAVKLLRSHGYTVLEAASGPDALQLVESHRGEINLLLTDVVMPQMSGTEVAEKLRGCLPGLKTLYVSGYTADSIVRHGVLQSEIAFLQKPYTAETLTRKVRTVLDD